jgi:Cu/Ag efflux pump CusA
LPSATGCWYRLLVLGGALLRFAWGIVSFPNLPIEAYPGVADSYVDIITQWPGISAEQIEQQVTIPLETAMNGIPGVVHLALLLAFRTCSACSRESVWRGRTRRPARFRWPGR